MRQELSAKNTHFCGGTSPRFGVNGRIVGLQSTHTNSAVTTDYDGNNGHISSCGYVVDYGMGRKFAQAFSNVYRWDGYRFICVMSSDRFDLGRSIRMSLVNTYVREGRIKCLRYGWGRRTRDIIALGVGVAVFLVPWG